MKKLSKRRKIGILLVVLLSGLLTILLFQISAASGSLTLTPSTKTVTQGKTFTAVLTADVDTPITIAQASISYDQNALQLNQIIDYSGSPLTSDTPEASNNPGLLQISRYKVGSPYPSGKFTVATITFTAKKTGSTTITLNRSNSLLYEASDATPNVLTQVAGTTISVTAPVVTNPKPPSEPQSPPPSQPPTGGSTSTGNQAQTNNSDTNSNQDTPQGDDAQPAAIIESVPDDSLPAPGTSRIASDPSLGTQLVQIGKNIAPILVLLAIAGGIGWFISKRLGHHSSFGGYKPAQAAGPGVVFDGSHTVKTNQDNNTQPPSPVR